MEGEHTLRPWGYVGIVAAIFAVAVTLSAPRAMGPLPEGLVTPVIAFELARDEAEIERMFGAPHSAERRAFRASMSTSTWLDFGLLMAYGALLAGIAASFAAREQDPARRQRARLAMSLAVVAAVLDALENRELLEIVRGLDADHGYALPLARLPLYVWPKWVALGTWFVLLAGPLFGARGAFRVAACAGACGALASLGALAVRGVFAEVMALGIALGIVALVPACFVGRRE
jgi:hypothetical protein